MVAAVVAEVDVVAAPVVSGTVAVAVAVVAVAVCVRRPETALAMVTLSIYQASIPFFQTRPTT